MLRVMLCGAADTDRIREQFSETVLQFGGEPWHYVSGRILHLNSGQANWKANSALTVGRADLCVFAIVERYGKITWNTEMRAVLEGGKPFLVLCLEETYEKYRTLKHAVVDRSAIADEHDRELLDLIAELQSEQRQTTITTFRYGSFREALREQMASLFEVLLGAQEQRNRRGAAVRLAADPAGLSLRALSDLRDVALDETEDKNDRKRAVGALAARRTADEDLVRALLSSDEQGVQRIAVRLLPDLVRGFTWEPDFVEHCVTVANGSDDVGVARRLIPALMAIDLGAALKAFELLDTSEIGTRRRLATAFEAAESEIRDRGLHANAVAILDRCMAGPGERGWLARCRELRDRLSGNPPEEG